jgi:hypothetical protein
LPAAFLLTKGNRELAKDGIFSWSIPALSSATDFGFTVTCPSAGACAALCYARTGTYRFSNVKAAHRRNLEAFLPNPAQWVARMISELRHRRYRPLGRRHEWDWQVRDDFAAWREAGGRSVRIHDAGDFFSREYLQAWAAVAASAPDVLFYAYTKEVSIVKAASLPPNFVTIFSLGGKQDRLVDLEQDRHADVFPSLSALLAAGYLDQGENDLMAPLLPSVRLGIVRNNIRHLVKQQGERSFSQLAL